MTERQRLNGYRIPRRIQRSTVQRPHPVTVKREREEEYQRWVHAENGGRDDFNAITKFAYRSKVARSVPEHTLLSRLFRWT